MDKDDKAATPAPGLWRRFFSLRSVLLAVLIILVFFAGIVWVTRDAVQSSVTPSDRELHDESDRVMGKIQILMTSAVVVRPGAASVIDDGVTTTRSAWLLADLDSDPGTGAWTYNGVKGLERAVIFRQAALSRRLLVRCYIGQSAPAKDILLTDQLDPSSAIAFLLQHQSVGGADRIKVTLGLRKGNSTTRSTRTFNIKRGAWKPGTGSIQVP